MSSFLILISVLVHTGFETCVRREPALSCGGAFTGSKKETPAVAAP